MDFVERKKISESRNTNQEIIAQRQIVFSVQTNPLLIDTVLGSLFTFVDYDTLKECRCVCQKWKDICDPKLIKRSAFVLQESTLKSFLDSPVDILSIFNSMKPEILLFSTFKFRVGDLNSALRQLYLEPNKQTMLQLEIEEGIWLPLQVEIEEGVWVPAEPTNDNADELIGPKLNKLKLLGFWVISLEKLRTIKHIDLTDCKIMVPSLQNENSVTKLAPQELRLTFCTFMQREEIGLLTQLGQIIDFSRMRKLELIRLSQPLRFTLNLSDCVTVKILLLNAININMNGRISPDELELVHNTYVLNGEHLSEIVLSNYITSSMTIGKFALKGSRRNEVFKFDNLKIDELEIKECTRYIGINEGTHIRILKLKRLHRHLPDLVNHLFELPQMLEYLEIHSSLNPNAPSCSSSNAITFPNLKHLFLKGYVNILPHFRKCPSLIHVQLERSKDSEMKIFNVDRLPPNIKGLCLENVWDSRVVGARDLKLDVLVLKARPQGIFLEAMFFLSQISTKVQADLLVFQGLGNSFDIESEKCIEEMVKCQSKYSPVNVVFGPVSWQNKELDPNSNLNIYVDKKAEYYLFDGNVGRGICEVEFLKMTHPFHIYKKPNFVTLNFVS